MKFTPSFFWMVKFGPLRSLSLAAWSIAWRFFSASSRRRLFSSMSRCFFSSTSRWRRSSSSFLRWAMRCSSSARETLRLACFSLSFFNSSSSFERCLRHSMMYSFNCSSRSDLFWSWRLMNSGSSALKGAVKVKGRKISEINAKLNFKSGAHFHDTGCWFGWGLENIS